MNPNLQFDMRQWQQAAREIFETSSRELPDFLNGQALRLSVESVRQTEKANTAQIEVELGAIATNIKQITRGKNKGKFRRTGTLIVENSLAERILVARRIKTGSWGVKGNLIADKVKNLIAARKRSAAFIKSGWIASRNKLFSVVREKPANATTIQGAKQYGRPKGSAKPATFSWFSNIETTITNTALLQPSKEPSVSRSPMPVAERGLSKALQICASDMMNKLAERMQRKLEKHNAR